MQLCCFTLAFSGVFFGWDTSGFFWLCKLELIRGLLQLVYQGYVHVRFFRGSERFFRVNTCGSIWLIRLSSSRVDYERIYLMKFVDQTTGFWIFFLGCCCFAVAAVVVVGVYEVSDVPSEFYCHRCVTSCGNRNRPRWKYQHRFHFLFTEYEITSKTLRWNAAAAWRSWHICASG